MRHKTQVGGGSLLAGGFGGMIVLMAENGASDANLWCALWLQVSFGISALVALLGCYVALSSYVGLPMPRTLDERRGPPEDRFRILHQDNYGEPREDSRFDAEGNPYKIRAYFFHVRAPRNTNVCCARIITVYRHVRRRRWQRVERELFDEDLTRNYHVCKWGSADRGLFALRKDENERVLIAVGQEGEAAFCLGPDAFGPRDSTPFNWGKRYPTGRYRVHIQILESATLTESDLDKRDEYKRMVREVAAGGLRAEPIFEITHNGKWDNLLVKQVDVTRLVRSRRTVAARRRAAGAWLRSKLEQR